MDFETIWYESTPYLYMVAAMVAIFHIGSTMGISAGLMLVIVSAAIIKMRLAHRKARWRKHDS